MALDRLDLSFAGKDFLRGIANPTEADEIRLKRIIRYVKGRPIARILYRWQDGLTNITTYTDSDWAGCVSTRKSTSGGVVLIGSHIVHHWSSTQANIAASSAEAELNAISKAAAETLGIADLARDCGQELDKVMKTDSSAANGIVHRRGCGKIKHLETRQLWVQEKVVEKKIKCEKIPREVNFSDMMTHHWTPAEGVRHFGNLDINF